ncbi:type II secretion system F family protein [Microbulbifer thermotolerans]|uniref:Type II secretion system protein F n=1 Tax=Microbulbifer thermotolerans TaxID=252514 RepID=A0A143HK76_MICTH|nr:type II secretion system F family protein [Microbulbifer thermotolerans]AMX02073.1 type II secretion system protein F [Microbulbifer thermotolerans]MCX2780735.1 type II secretion system F family protein [Microbulbifer thermotolerans]MCX2793866.1 type II secretion system F family protein [Microbulbifer thermotolerans]MCX2806466.1 type II secretion system F family protein [Microbulbifer thermotolerans]MCX2834306.1 type II secretion system F family protein [Microbulbifer thermotolerans]
MANAAAVTYVYKGVDSKGNKVEGEINGTSPALIKAQLRKQGIIANRVQKKPKPLFGGKKKVKPEDIALFTRQMATMMKAGVPLVQSFEIVADGLDNQGVKELIFKIRDDVASGTAFADALRKHPLYFDDLFCNLVASGEQSGALETMLDRIATYKEKTESLKKKIKKAMTYPIAVIVVAIVVTSILLIKVVPQFAETFSSFGADLPAFTQMVVGMSEWMQANWFIALICAVIGIGGTLEAKKRNKKVADFFDRLILKMPILGQITYNSIAARFARTLSTTFAAGVPLIDALKSVAGATGNVIYEDATLKIRDSVATGIPLNGAMRASNLYPTMLVQMAAIGEESGALDEMLGKAADFYEEAVDNMVDNLTTLLEPMIMAVLGILVGGLMVAMYLPIFQLGQVV